MKLLLLACGDIGNRVIAGIDRTSWQVAAMRRRIEQLPQTVEAYGGDATQSESLRQVISAVAPDVIIVTMRPGEMSDAGYRNSYVKVAENLSTILSEWYKGLLIWVSSTGVYGQHDGEWVDEGSTTEPQHFRGKRLLQAEQVMIESGLAVTVVRFSGIYGPGRERLLSNIRAGRLASPENPSWSNRIHSDDCAAALLHLLEKYRAGEALESVYIGSDSEPTLDVAMQRELAGLLGISVEPDSREVDHQVSAAGRRCSNQRLLASGFRLQYPSWRDGYRMMIGEAGF